MREGAAPFNLDSNAIYEDLSVAEKVANSFHPFTCGLWKASRSSKKARTEELQDSSTESASADSFILFGLCQQCGGVQLWFRTWRTWELTCPTAISWSGVPSRAFWNFPSIMSIIKFFVLPMSYRGGRSLAKPESRCVNRLKNRPVHGCFDWCHRMAKEGRIVSPQTEHAWNYSSLLLYWHVHHKSLLPPIRLHVHYVCLTATSF